MNNKTLIVIGIVALVILFAPIPYRYGPISCQPCITPAIDSCYCPKEGDWGFHPSLIVQVYYKLIGGQTTINTISR